MHSERYKWQFIGMPDANASPWSLMSKVIAQAALLANSDNVLGTLGFGAWPVWAGRSIG